MTLQFYAQGKEQLQRQLFELRHLLFANWNTDISPKCLQCP